MGDKLCWHSGCPQNCHCGLFPSFSFFHLEHPGALPTPQHKLLRGPTVRYLFFARDVYLPEPTAHLAGVFTSSHKGGLVLLRRGCKWSRECICPWSIALNPLVPVSMLVMWGCLGTQLPTWAPWAPLSPHVDRHPPVMLKSVFYILSFGRVGTS